MKARLVRPRACFDNVSFEYESTFLALFDFLNAGPRSTLKDVPEDFYDADSEEEENVTTAKKGRPRKLKPVEEFFIALCRLRRGSSERHLAHLYGVHSPP